MSRGGLRDYQTVDERLREWWGDHPQGRIITSIVESGDKTWTVLAEAYRDADDARPCATGMAYGDPQGSSGAQATNPLEDAETSAIGRALANAGYSPKGARPSQEEMRQAEARQGDPAPQQPRQSRPAPTQEPSADGDAPAWVVAAGKAGMSKAQALRTARTIAESIGETPPTKAEAIKADSPLERELVRYFNSEAGVSV